MLIDDASEAQSTLHLAEVAVQITDGDHSLGSRYKDWQLRGLHSFVGSFAVPLVCATIEVAPYLRDGVGRWNGNEL